MPQVEQVHQRTKKPAIVLAIVVSAVVVAGVSVAVYLLSRPSVPKPKTADVQVEAREKAFSGDKDEAIRILEQQLTQTNSAEEKTSIYMQMGTLYGSKDDKAKAFELFKKAAELTPNSYGVNDSVAAMAEALGDKATAIDYLKRNRAILKDPENQVVKSLEKLEARIIALGGTL